MQNEQTVGKTIAFKLAYLLGVEKHVLERDYSGPYEASKNLALFSNYEDAQLLRSLSRLRQSVLRYNVLYRSELTVDNASNGHLTLDIEYLKNRGFLVEKIYEENDKVGYINILTEKINEILVNVLKVLGVPRANILKEYFYFPEFTKKSLEKYLLEIKTLSYPHGVIIYRGVKIKQSLSFSLTNDNNIFYSVYSIREERYDKGVVDTDDYVWSTTKLYAQDVDFVDEVVDTPILEETGESFVEEISQALGNLKKHDVSINVELPKTAVADVDILLNTFLGEEKAEIYVDCDNMDFFKFLNFVISAEAKKAITSIKLVVDTKSSVLWKVFTDIYSSRMDVEIINVKRLKEQKSVADIVLTSKVCEGVFKRGLHKVILMSSDSDFFGLIQVLSEYADFCVCYTDLCTNDEYLKFLTNESVTAISLTSYESEETVNTYKDICIEYLLAYSLMLTPMCRWENSYLISAVLYHFNKETELEIAESYVSSKVEELMKNVTISVTEDKTVVKLDKVSVNARNLFQA